MSLEKAWGMYQWKVIPEENLTVINVLKPRPIPKSFPVKIVLYRNLVIDLYRLVYFNGLSCERKLWIELGKLSF